MAVSNDYLHYVLEQLAGIPDVTTRRMFGGVGLYSNAVFFGLIDDDTLYFKVDDTNRPDYTTRGMSPFRPFRDKPDLSMSYFTVPADALEEPGELAAWAHKSISAAASTARSRRPKSKSPLKSKPKPRTVRRR